MESLQVGNNSCTYVRGRISSSQWTLKLAKRESYRASRLAGGQGRRMRSKAKNTTLKIVTHDLIATKTHLTCT